MRNPRARAGNRSRACNLPIRLIDVPQQAYVDAVLGVYELNRIELLRDIFVWAYRSCQQYVAVQQYGFPPDTFRLRCRNELTEAARAIVRGGQHGNETSDTIHHPRDGGAGESAALCRTGA